jgi:hypothetical protein
MTNRATLRLKFTKKAILAAVGTAALAAPVVVGVVHVSAIRAQSSLPKFEVASIKLCQPGDVPRGGGRGSGGAGGSDPGLLRFTCVPVDRLIRLAYLRYASAKPEPEAATFSLRIMNQDIAGEPGWAQSDRYTIDAKPETPQSIGMMRGPMLQTLLEERFKLKIHQDDKEVPVYALVVGKGAAKLTAPRRAGALK